VRPLIPLGRDSLRANLIIASCPIPLRPLGRRSKPSRPKGIKGRAGRELALKGRKWDGIKAL